MQNCSKTSWLKIFQKTMIMIFILLYLRYHLLYKIEIGLGTIASAFCKKVTKNARIITKFITRRVVSCGGVNSQLFFYHSQLTSCRVVIKVVNFVVVLTLFKSNKSGINFSNKLEVKVRLLTMIDLSQIMQK